MDSSSDEGVKELEWPTKKLKFSFSHTQDRWHFVRKDEEGQHHQTAKTIRYSILWIISKLLFSGLFQQCEVSHSPFCRGYHDFWHICLADCPFLIFAYEVPVILCCGTVCNETIVTCATVRMSVSNKCSDFYSQLVETMLRHVKFFSC